MPINHSLLPRLQRLLAGLPLAAFRRLRRLLLALVSAVIVFAALFAYGTLGNRQPGLAAATPPAIDTPMATRVPAFASPTSTKAALSTLPPAIASPTPAATANASTATIPAGASSLLVLSLQDGANSRLFAYQPGSLPLTRLAGGDWDDATPAFSPDGASLVFASNRSGAWDLYIFDINSGTLRQLTDSLAYDASPSFSPDSRWLAYESYTQDGGLDIFVLPTDGSAAPMRLTDSPGADFSPAWSPLGRQLAFVSDRNGSTDIWLANLDDAADRFRNLTNSRTASESHPAWSPDGEQLAWSTRGPDGIATLTIWEAGSTHPSPGSGSWPAWDPDGSQLLAAIETPNQAYLAGYDAVTQRLALPPLPLPGALQGITWGKPAADLVPAQAIPPPQPLWQVHLALSPDMPEGRLPVIPLENVEAPTAALQDLVDESFAALRQQVAGLAGWDFLASLENAFVPLTTPLAPGMAQDWLYTARAFAFNPLPVNAGWVVVCREDFGAQTYWRIFVRARLQDGSLGEPLHASAWDFSARLTGDPEAYEQGGAPSADIPPGYWIDFTRLAAAYGWERLPALLPWRSSYASARFNEFALTGGLDWQSAMLEIYPPEALTAPPSPSLPAEAPKGITPSQPLATPGLTP